MKLPALVSLLIATSSLAADDSETLAPIFNGKDLTGWVPVNIAPGTFTVRDGELVTTGHPIGVIRTEKMYENFILELEWRHIQPKGNAGVFVWSHPLTAQGTPFAKSIEVQVLDGHETANSKRAPTSDSSVKRSTRT